MNDPHDPTRNDLEILDMRVIASLKELGGEEDPGLVLELVGMFLQDAPLRMKEIETSLANGDILTLERAAHTLKSSSANIGALGLSELCRRIVESARANHPEALPELCQASVQSLAEAATNLRSLKS